MEDSVHHDIPGNGALHQIHPCLSLRRPGIPLPSHPWHSAIAENRISREDYLQGELVSEIRHEYVAGNVYAMSGGTLNHQRIAGNFMRLPETSLPENPAFPPAAISSSRCRSAGRGGFLLSRRHDHLRAGSGRRALHRLPERDSRSPQPDTRRIDEVQKFRDYITIPTLGTYILAETESPFLTLHRRDGTGFRRDVLSGPDAILDLPEAGITIPL
jgi:hypothetical protein